MACGGLTHALAMLAASHPAGHCSLLPLPLLCLQEYVHRIVLELDTLTTCLRNNHGKTGERLSSNTHVFM